MLQSAIVTGFVGHVDASSLGAMVLCVTAFNVSGLSLVMGAASGAETLSGQVKRASELGSAGNLPRSAVIDGTDVVNASSALLRNSAF